MKNAFNFAVVGGLAAGLLGSAAIAAEPVIHLPSTLENVKRGFISPDTPPVLRIKSGQTVAIDTISHGGLTEDPVAFYGQAGIPPEGVLPDAIAVAKATKENGWAGHVLTGPIYIEGAEPGDLLEVRILKFDNRVPYGVNSPGNGGVAPNMLTARTQKVIKLDLKRRVALLNEKVEVPLRNFMGILAVAPSPAVGKVGSRAPGEFGGNMDFKELQAGSTLYLPVLAPGGLFVTGDSHATQGDGEVDGNAVEASLTATLQFIVHKGAGKDRTWPYAENGDYWFILGMDPDLDVALKNAVIETNKFLVGKGLTPSDAYALSSIGIDYGIAEAVDQNLVVYARIRKSMFKK